MKSKFLVSVLFLLFFSACATNPNQQNQKNQQNQQNQQTQTTQKFNRQWKKISWQDLPNWKEATQNDHNLQQSWDAFLLSCKAWKNNQKLNQWKTWQNICNNAQNLAISNNKNNKEIIEFFENNLSAYEVINANNPNDYGTLTGYYEPLLYGSLTKTNRYKYAIYGEPENLLTIDFADLFDIYPELKNKRLRGRLDKNSKKILPYWDRQQLAEFEKEKNQNFANTGKPLLFVDDDVALFFLQIQGSGRIKLENGDFVRISYANQNGREYKSIGRILVKNNELPLSQATMQGIKQWIKNNPSKKQWLFNQNPSFVFFKISKELSANDGAIGSLGIPLTAERSIAIDPRAIPLGTPIFMNTQIANKEINRLVMAQDTGGAIKGEIRADLFCGFGDKAGELAGSMNQKLKLWALFPKDLTTEQLPK